MMITKYLNLKEPIMEAVKIVSQKLQVETCVNSVTVKGQIITNDAKFKYL
jgi:hypothetical protein